MKPWYKSLTFRALIGSALVHLLTIFGVTEEVASKGVADFLEAALPFAGLIADAIAAYGRKRATQGITATKSDAAKSLVSLLVIAPLLMLVLSGCAGTRAAYKEAENIDEQAYVAAEHYASLLREAVVLKGKATTPGEAIAAMQEAAAKIQPVVLRIKNLRDAYAKVHSAQTEAELQDAVDEAILLIADLVRAVNTARGEPASRDLRVPPLLEGSPYDVRLAEVLR